MRIIFTGAQGTGKTTILKLFGDEFPVITNVCRTLAKDGVKINEMGDDESQRTIFDTYCKLLSQENYISDRGLTDVISYSKWLWENGKLSDTEYQREVEVFNKWHRRNKPIYFYFPIEFECEDDGTRSVNKEFREKVSRNIKDFLLQLYATGDADVFHTVTGSVENRFNIINKVLNFYKVYGNE